MLAWIVALILFFCLVVFVALTILLLKGVKKINYDTAFVATFEDRGMDSIEESLKAMIAKANREILIASPWITYGAWRRIKWDVAKFVKKGGELKVFLKGNADDFARGSSDRSVVDEVIALGGVVRFVPKLHAKLYVVDRCEALIAAANLSKSGLDWSYEAGVWSCNPAVVRDVCAFVDTLV